MNLKERLAILKQVQKPSIDKSPETTVTRKPSTEQINGWIEVAPGVYEKRSQIDPSIEFGDLSLSPWFSNFKQLRGLTSDFFAFDTETTGLSGGAGTLIFLAGGSYWAEGDKPIIETRQMFLSDFGYEFDFVLRLRELVGSRNRLCTYNGSSFDLPLLRSRFIMKGLRPPTFEHLDALYPARRLWKSLIGSCSLGDIEREVLGYKRLSDVPGFLIPKIFFDSLKSKRGPDYEGLGPVFTHHQKDTQSLLVLAGLLESIEGENLKIEPSLGPSNHALHRGQSLKVSYRSHLNRTRGTEGEAKVLSELHEQILARPLEDFDRLEIARLCRLAWVRAKKCGNPDLRLAFIDYAARFLGDPKAQKMIERING